MTLFIYLRTRIAIVVVSLPNTPQDPIVIHVLNLASHALQEVQVVAQPVYTV